MRTRVAVLLCGALVGGLAVAAPATAATRAMPGHFTGYAFDTCHAPSQAAMDRWRESSPYWGIGIYIAGDSRFCKEQENLTPSWTATQSRRGWRILPLTVGRQASCFVSQREDITRIDPDPTDSYAAATAQGRNEAVTTAAASKALGIARGSTQWLDIEAFDVSRTHCRRSMLAFVSGWTAKLHSLGYRSGFYSSAASGITALEGARTQAPASYHLPDQLWVAEWNNKASTGTSYVAPEGWRKQRIHQYRGGHPATYGHVRINIDSDWLDIGGGSRTPRPAPHCRVPIDFPTYGTLRRGVKGPKVATLQCLLRQTGLYKGRLHGRFDRRTAGAVRRFQRQHEPLKVNGIATRATWVALHSAGPSPLMKVGSASNAVRRLQRSLNAAASERLTISGVFDKVTAGAVKRYQRERHLPATGVVTSATWAQLRAGRR